MLASGVLVDSVLHNGSFASRVSVGNYKKENQAVEQRSTALSSLMAPGRHTQYGFRHREEERSDCSIDYGGA